MKQDQSQKLFSTDTFMKTLYVSLLGDFRTALEDPDYRVADEFALRQGASAWRQTVRFPERRQAPPLLFKMEAQLESLFKRYIFKADLYSDEELEINTFENFMETQLRICRVQWAPRSIRVHTVLQHARHLAKKILADFDPSMGTQYCRFSQRATWGNPAHEAYLDHKLSDPISGSLDHLEWFRNHLTQNELLSATIMKCQGQAIGITGPHFRSVSSLKLIGVPKSYKSLRLISPNTAIGSYYTYGLGVILAEALKAEGLDITKLQDIHKVLARKASRGERKLVTTDMSSASESFYWALLCAVLPRKWLRALDMGRLRRFSWQGITDKKARIFHYASFMAMGIGFTFPLQTLLFYCIIKSVQSLLGVNGRVSVYGDDLIYPKSIHSYVISIFNEIGMKVNKEKSFCSSDFRESCGGDYYHGVDVRPFSPEGGYQELTARKYEAWLYQLANGLFNRWPEEFLPKTTLAIKKELLRCTWLIKQVPPSYPDSSGWRVEVPNNDPLSAMSPVRVTLSNGSRSYHFSYLEASTRKRFVSYTDPYLYDWLRARSRGEEEMFAEGFDCWPMALTPQSIKRWWKSFTALRWSKRPSYIESRETLSYVRAPHQPRKYRGLGAKRLTRTLPVTSCVLTKPTYKSNQPQVLVSDWI